MPELHLNKSNRFFYFQTRIHGLLPMVNKEMRRTSIAASQWASVWKIVLDSIAELKSESGIEVYGIIIEAGSLKTVFSTPYFNENILILDWELRIRKKGAYCFDRPVLCEPLPNDGQVKIVLMEIYSQQIRIQKTGFLWLHPFSSLKLLLDGDLRARLFNDPLKVIFKPEIILRLGKRVENPLSVENQSIDS